MRVTFADSGSGLLRGLASLTLILCATATVTAAAPAAVDAPARVSSRLGTSAPPLWVSAEELVADDGEIDWSGLRLATARLIQSAPKGECVDFGPVDYDLADTRPYSSRGDVRARAFGLFRGRVRALTPGFYSSMPGTLLSVEIDAVQRGPDHWATGRTVYVFYPQGELTLGEHRICVHDPRVPALPAVGDRLFVFPSQRPVDVETNLVMPYRQEILIERAGPGRADQAVAVPPTWDTKEGFRGLRRLDEAPALVAAEERREP